MANTVAQYTSDLHVIEAGLEGLSVHGSLVAVVCELDQVVHLVGKDSVMVGVVVERITTELVSGLQHLLHTQNISCSYYYLTKGEALEVSLYTICFFIFQ